MYLCLSAVVPVMQQNVFNESLNLVQEQSTFLCMCNGYFCVRDCMPTAPLVTSDHSSETENRREGTVNRYTTTGRQKAQRVICQAWASNISHHKHQLQRGPGSSVFSPSQCVCVCVFGHKHVSSHAVCTGSQHPGYVLRVYLRCIKEKEEENFSSFGNQRYSNFQNKSGNYVQIQRRRSTAIVIQIYRNCYSSTRRRRRRIFLWVVH